MNLLFTFSYCQSAQICDGPLLKLPYLKSHSPGLCWCLHFYGALHMLQQLPSKQLHAQHVTVSIEFFNFISSFLAPHEHTNTSVEGISFVSPIWVKLKACFLDRKEAQWRLLRNSSNLSTMGAIMTLPSKAWIVCSEGQPRHISCNIQLTRGLSFWRSLMLNSS